MLFLVNILMNSEPYGYSFKGHYVSINGGFAVLLTALCGSSSTCGLFFFLVLLVTSTKPPLGQTLNHTTCDVYAPKSAETLLHGKCYRYYLFILLIFLALSKHWVQREYNIC